MGDEKGGGACKVFIGGLNLNTTKDSLKSFFEQYGEIVDAVVMRDPTTKRSRGFGFVTYSDPKCVDECLAGIPHVVDDRQVDAKRAIPREETPPMTTSSAPQTHQTKKVFLGGLSPDTTEDEIREVLEAIGIVTDVTIQREKVTEKPRGFGFATFESTEAVEKLCMRRYIKIKDRDVEVKKAISQEEMRRVDSGVRSRSGGQQGGYRDNSYGGGGGRDSYSSGYSRGGGGGGGVYPMAGYDYRGYGGGDYSRPESYYPYPSYDRNTAAAYAYANSYGRGYDMAAAYGMYGAQAGMSGGGYTQTPSSYGPARGYGSAPMGGAAVADSRSGAAGRQQAYHPYRRN